MMADRNTLQATLTGEANVHRPSKPESAPSIVFTDPELELVTPELGHQVQIQAEILKDWLRFKAKNHILAGVFDSEVDEIGLDQLVEDVYKPELHTQQVQHFEAAMSVARVQLPQLQQRLTRAGLAYDIAKEEHATAQIEREKENPAPYYRMNMGHIVKRVNDRKKDVSDLTTDITNIKLVGHTHESMLLHIKGLARDIDTEPELRAEFDTLSLEARVLAYEEALGILDEKIQAETVREQKEVYVRQREALSLELSFYKSENDHEDDGVQAELVAYERPVQVVMQPERRTSILSSISSRSIRLFQALNFR